MNPFLLLIGGVTLFIVIRALFWALVEIPCDHAKDEAICETCFKKMRNDAVTEPLEWCDCPNREEEVDEHGEGE
jgi:hypothetical protein